MLDKDPIKDIVRKAYRDVFDRQPDPEGLAHYYRLLSNRNITTEQLYGVLKSSDEYKDRMAILTVDESKRFEGKIAYIQTIYVNDFDNALRNVYAFKDFGPDIKCIVVYDDTITQPMVRSFQDTINVTLKYSKWLDDLPRQRNVALNEARKLGAEWVISSDPDEHYNEDFIRDIRSIIQAVIDVDIPLIQVNQHTLYDGEEVATEYFKDLVYKFGHGVAYQGYGNMPVWHEGIFGFRES